MVTTDPTAWLWYAMAASTMVTQGGSVPVTSATPVESSTSISVKDRSAVPKDIPDYPCIGYSGLN